MGRGAPLRGYRTSRLTFKDVDNIFDARQILEAATAERAASCITEDALQWLEKLECSYRPGSTVQS